jgi:hypothetical protein
MESAEFATNIDAFPPRHSTAQIQRELPLLRGGNHGRAEIFALPPNFARTLPDALRLRPKESQTPNAPASPNSLARFRKSIKGDGEDDNDADNDLLNVR